MSKEPMTLKEFIKNLQILSEKYPNAMVEDADYYSIYVNESLLSSNTTPWFRYNWSRTAYEQEYAKRQAGLQNQFNR